MDGQSLLYKLRQLLNEDADSGFLDKRTSYDYLWEAAIEFVNRTACLKSTQTITTVAAQTGYTLNADFLNMYMKDSSNRLYIKYNNGSADTFVTWKDYESIVYSNNTSSQSIPGSFSIIDDATLDSQVSGSATSAGALSGGQATLTDTATDFSDVSAGDVIHNTTDASDGMVLSKTSSTVLVTALLGGTNNAWAINDAYIIQPQGRLKLVLDGPPLTAGHTITVYYVQRPAPVYSDYGVYRFPLQYSDAIVKYAAFLYKFKDREPNFGHTWYGIFDRQVRMASSALNKSFIRKGFTVNLKARR